MRCAPKSSQRADSDAGGSYNVDDLFDRFAFRGRDPAQADENLYRYCEDDPIDATDPTGLKIYDKPPEATYFLDEILRIRASKGASYLDDEVLAGAKQLIGSFKDICKKFTLIPHWITFNGSEDTPTVQFAKDAAARAANNPNSVFLYIGHGILRSGTQNVNASDVKEVQTALNGIPNNALLWFAGCFGGSYNQAIGKNAFQNMPTNETEVSVTNLTNILNSAMKSLREQLDAASKRAGCAVEVNIYFGEYHATADTYENRYLKRRSGDGNPKPTPEQKTWMTDYSFPWHG
jgi:hypothetical protein